MQPAVFLDRDGTMIHDVGYLYRVEDVSWFPWTIEAIRLLNRAGFLVCVATNQGGIALGYATEEAVRTVHARMQETLEAGGARVDGWFYCPHHPHGKVEALSVTCSCRKPAPGLVHQACASLAIDLERSFVVGDKLSDVSLAGRVGARGVLVRTGYGEGVVRARAGVVPEAAAIAGNLMEATSWILAEHGRAESGV